jgi:hypothetical protein
VLEYFPDPYPGELLYSVWARFSDQVRYPNRRDVSQELFGNCFYHALIDWTCSLGYLVDHLPAGHCYTVDRLINNHTLFPLYAPFLSSERRHLLRDQMITGNGKALSARLGMMTSHIPNNEWLRYCPACVMSDRDRYGEIYWHRLHQAPGVLVCPTHATFLEDSAVARSPQFRGFIPAEGAIGSVLPCLVTNPTLYKLINDVAECIDQLLSCGYTSHGHLFFRKQYFTLLERWGFVTINGSLRVVEFLKSLTDYYSPSFLRLLHCGLSQTRHIEAEWPARLPFARRPQHPLHHILVIRFLGSTIENFLSTPILQQHLFGQSPWPCLNTVCEQYRLPCITHYSVRKNSLKGRPTGLFACPYCGFTYSRVGPDRSPEDAYRRDRIPFYGRMWLAKLGELWPDSHTSTEQIARCLGVDFNTVTRQAKRLQLPPRRVLRKRSVPNQDEHEELEQRREEWMKLIEQHAQEGITALISHTKGARTTFNWLNRHDREWLLSHLPPRKIPRRTKAHLYTTFRSKGRLSDKGREEERDEITSQSVRSTAHQVVKSPGEPIRVTRAQLEKATPALGWLLSRPNVFPQTVQAFQEVRETGEAFALRRVQWTLQQYQEECTWPTRKEFILRAKVKKALRTPSVQEAVDAALIALARKDHDQDGCQALGSDLQLLKNNGGEK